MITFDRFLQLLSTCGLISEGQVAAVVAELQPSDHATDPTSVAKLSELLIARGILTHWQCAELAKGQEIWFLFQNKYELLGRLPHGQCHYGYRARSIATMDMVEVIFISYHGQTTVAIVRPEQLVDALLLSSADYLEKFLSTGKYTKCSRSVGGTHNSTTCNVRESATGNSMVATFVPTDDSVSVFITRPHSLIEIGRANWAPFN